MDRRHTSHLLGDEPDAAVRHCVFRSVSVEELGARDIVLTYLQTPLTRSIGYA